MHLYRDFREFDQIFAPIHGSTLSILVLHSLLSKLTNARSKKGLPFLLVGQSIIILLPWIHDMIEQRYEPIVFMHYNLFLQSINFYNSP
jgi:hypothetical protein